MGAEYELKFRSNTQVQSSLQKDFPGPWETITMQTTYYDTPSGSLSAGKYMLRQRTENGIRVCTLKTPGKGNERGEWEVRCDCITEAIPTLCKLGAPAELAVLCEEGLVAICGARFTRQAALLQLSGCRAELALDSGVLFSQDRELPLCEVELELKEGSKEALDGFAQSFAARYGLTAEEKSKFARALPLYKEV